ncbi:hypothetical protein [Leptospira weilii]|uniref:hypothetical protein n=1 Tax=Leptospira weilii TaxID=28184 RepID=UPI0012BAB838|nr:hypothetical protein [Leptospira weilii]
MEEIRLGADQNSTVESLGESSPGAAIHRAAPLGFLGLDRALGYNLQSNMLYDWYILKY